MNERIADGNKGNGRQLRFFLSLSMRDKHNFIVIFLSCEKTAVCHIPYQLVIIAAALTHIECVSTKSKCWQRKMHTWFAYGTPTHARTQHRR